MASVKTYFNGEKLVIEREGMTISFGNSRMTVHGSVGSFVMGDIVKGKAMGTSISQGKVLVGVALAEAPVPSRSRVAATSPCSICGKLAWTSKSKAQATSPLTGKSHTWKSKSPAPVV